MTDPPTDPPASVLDQTLDSPPAARSRRRPGSHRLTVPQVRLLQAWRQLRAHNPWQQPTQSELAHVLGLTVSSVHRQVVKLCECGVLVRVHGDNRLGRCYALAAEAAARPHIVDLVRLATDLVRLRPASAHSGPGVEEYAALWARAHAIVQDISLLASRKHADTMRRLRKEASEDGDIAGPPTPE